MGEPTAPAIEARGIYHIYRGRDVETVALRGADVVLNRGTWTTIMGPSGSGKSTLLHVLAGLLEPTAGSVRMDSEDLTRLDPDERARRRRRHIGVVLQRDNLHPLLNVADNVALPLRLDGRSRRDVGPRVRDMLTSVGIADRRRQRTGQLSGGEAQRVAIAVALVTQPRVLLTDEPTGELDETSTAAMLDLLEALREQVGTAILTVTHNPSVARRADRRLVMRDGLIADAE
jgi:ABC-type lipoprotein export system ATPase subunit